MSTTEAACLSTPQQAGLQIESLPFDRIPHQSRLFLDYLRDPQSLRKFYPNTVQFHQQVSARAAEVIDNYVVDRGVVTDALERMNLAWGAPAAVLDNIQLLKQSDTVAVVSGQQAGLFTGPLYTIYKALSAVKLARCLTLRGTRAVPVFWIATEDHDFAEVATAEFIACDCRLAGVAASSEMHQPGATVGSVVLDPSIDDTVAKLLESLPSSEFSGDIERMIRDAYAPGRGYGDAFARLLTSLIGQYGLILLDPRDETLKNLAAPLYAEAALKAPLIAEAVEHRSRELEQSGYHAQVLATGDSFPLFIHTEGDRRHAITRTANGKYRAKDLKEEYTAQELAEWARSEPQRFSPNVTLRSVVQDYLLPTIAYFGGGAEIAYFAQTAEVYQGLGRPVTPIIHRASMTIVETRTRRALERYGLSIEDFFSGEESVITRVVEEHLGADTAKRFVKSSESINAELDSLKESLMNIDPTLAEALDTGRKKINYQIEGLRARFHRAQMSRDQAAHRQLERAFAQLYPHKTLQERHINITSLLARHGRYAIDWIFDAINLNFSDHQVVYL